MDKLKVVKGNQLQDFDPFRVMDKLDDDLFLEEMKGRIVDTWAYSFNQDGKEVRGLSKIGVDQACREMAKKGEVIREENVEYAIDPTDKRYILFKGSASRIAVSKDGVEIVLDRTIGTKRQCVFVITKIEGITNRVNNFWFEQGSMKALRNARLRLLSEEVKTKVITIAKESGKTREIKKEDDVSTDVETDKKSESPAKTTTTKKTSKDILYEELSSYCMTDDGIDTNLMDSIIKKIAFKKDKTAVQSWDEIKNVDGQKYEKWFVGMLANWHKHVEG